MSTGRKYNLISKLSLFVIAFCFTCIAAFASNSLTGVDVKQMGESSYNIILKTDSSVNVKKIVDGKDNITLLLKSTIPSDSVEIVYDNASDLYNVMVQRKNDDSTMVLLEGKNINNAIVYTKEISTGDLKQVDANGNSLNNHLYLANLKYFSFSLMGIIFIFMLMHSFRPKSKNNVAMNQKQIRSKKHTTINSMKKNASVQKRYVPSINYRIANAKSNMSMPNDFVISNAEQYQEKIRKAG